jgi:hypothetical protein
LPLTSLHHLPPVTFLSCRSLVLMVTTDATGNRFAKTTSRCIVFLQLCGFEWPNNISIKAAARWFQSIEPELDFSDWQGFCRLLHDRFDCDKNNYSFISFSTPNKPHSLLIMSPCSLNWWIS